MPVCFLMLVQVLMLEGSPLLTETSSKSVICCFDDNHSDLGEIEFQISFNLYLP